MHAECSALHREGEKIGRLIEKKSHRLDHVPDLWTRSS